MQLWRELMLPIKVDLRVRITRPGVFQGRCGVVVEAENDRQVANVLLDEDNAELPPPYGVVGTVEEDYAFLQVIG
jgi:hypothetical protein